MTRLPYLKSPRAEKLFEAVNDRYFEFAAQLPQPLNDLATTTGTFEGTSNVQPFGGLPDLNPGLAGIPWLFWDVFSDLDDATFLEIAEASMYTIFASIVMDHILDDQAGPANAMSMFHRELFWRGVAGYQKQFSSGSIFWDHYDRLIAENTEGLSAELRAQSDPSLLDLESLIAASYGKASPLIIATTALGVASGQDSLLDPLESTLKSIMVASQMLDDLGDWEHDLEVGHMTLYLASIAPETDWSSRELPSVADIQNRIDAEWLDVRQAHNVIEWLDRALAAVESINCPIWVDYVNGYRTLADKHADNFTIRHLVRILEPIASAPA